MKTIEILRAAWRNPIAPFVVFLMGYALSESFVEMFAKWVSA